MKKILFVFVLFLTVNFSFAAFTVSKPVENPPELTKAEADRAMMEMVVKMSVKDYETLTGKKMSFTERLAFKVTKKRFEKQLLRAADVTAGFNIGGFALGLLLGVIGVILAHIFSKDTNLRKWSWIGLGVWVAIVLIAVVL
jgi:hypothetical protein